MVRTSIVICSYNQGNLLERALYCLKEQTAPSSTFEVIVVNDCSTDDTSERLESLLHRFSRSEALPRLISMTTTRNQGLANAANLGWHSARGTHVLFTDADCLPDKDWVEKMSSALEVHPVVAGGVDTPRSNYWLLSHNIAQFHPFLLRRREGETLFIAGANMGFRRHVLEGHAGFEEGRRSAPDNELVFRLHRAGVRVWFDPRARVEHRPERTNFRRAVAYAYHQARHSIHLRLRFGAMLRTPWWMGSPVLLRVLSPGIALGKTLQIFGRGLDGLRFLHTAPVIVCIKVAWCWGAARGLAASCGVESAS